MAGRRFDFPTQCELRSHPSCADAMPQKAAVVADFIRESNCRRPAEQREYMLAPRRRERGGSGIREHTS